MSPPAPKVSICIPTYNGGRWIEETLRTALGQTYEDIEVLVVDDASSDDTVARVRAFGDSRVRVSVNEVNRGLVGNWNRSVALARGDHVKFLFQDDILYPTCVERMVSVMERSSRIGLVFARREMLFEDADDPASRQWLADYADVDRHLGPLQEVNSGRELFERCLAMRFWMNVVGEPTSVMVRRACFERVGLFNTRMHQATDLEMWVRLMFFYDVGFIPEALSEFRFHARSTTVSNHLDNRAWFDRLWLVEGLLRHEEIRRAYPRLRTLRWVEAARAAKATLSRVKRRLPISPSQHRRVLGEYLRYRLARVAGRAPDIHC